MSRRRGQSIYRRDHVCACQLPSLRHALPRGKFGYGRCARHRRNAAFRLEPNLVDAPGSDLYGKANDVTTHRILNLCHAIGICEIAHIPGMLEMIE
jgi:hypothetical protein